MTAGSLMMILTRSRRQPILHPGKMRERRMLLRVECIPTMPETVALYMGWKHNNLPLAKYSGSSRRIRRTMSVLLTKMVVLGALSQQIQRIFCLQNYKICCLRRPFWDRGSLLEKPLQKPSGDWFAKTEQYRQSLPCQYERLRLLLHQRILLLQQMPEMKLMAADALLFQPQPQFPG